MNVLQKAPGRGKSGRAAVKPLLHFLMETHAALAHENSGAARRAFYSSPQRFHAAG
jgi:hypothetical protein